MMLFSFRRSSSLVLAVTVALGCALTAHAQEKEKDKEKPLVFGSDVALVQVPVFVSGRGGSAVEGLTAKDFEVQQDGKDVDVVSFRFVDTTAPELQDEIRVQVVRPGVDVQLGQVGRLVAATGEEGTS